MATPLASALRCFAVAALLATGCSTTPTLKRLECSGSIQRSVVFDTRSGQLYSYLPDRSVYRPTPELRFSVQTTSSLRDGSLVIETRVGEFSGKEDAATWAAVEPPVGHTTTINLSSLKETVVALTGRPGVQFPDRHGLCRWAPLQTQTIESS